MTITTEEFERHFHSLTGTTIGERRQCLFFLLNQTKDSNSINVASIQPNTPLEECFKVEVLVRFKKVPELIDVLRSENIALIEKVLKVPWFLDTIFDYITPDELVNKIFPSLGFNVKVKIINKLAVCLNDTNRADEMFNAVHEKYGMFLASKLLPCCSGDLIISKLQLVRIELTPRQLLVIIKKYPELTEGILESLKKFQGQINIGCKYINVFKYIMRNDIVLFLKLKKNYRTSGNLGRRSTTRFISSYREIFLKEPDRFYRLLHKKQVPKCIFTQHAEFFYNILPTSLGKLKNDYNWYLDLLPRNQVTFKLVIASFRERYGFEIWKDQDLITPQLLELMPSEERDIWMQANPKPKQISEEIWICLKKIERSIPELKKKICMTSDVKERAEIIGCLVDSCRLNGDKVALVGVCQYVLAHHRNDNLSVLRTFLTTLKKCFILDKLEEIHWKYINEIVQIFAARNAIPYYYNDWLFTYIEYRIANDLTIEEQIKQLTKKVHMGVGWSSYFTVPKYEKKFILTYGKIIPELYKKDDLESRYTDFLHNVMSWNQKHPKELIPLDSFEEAFRAVLNVAKSEQYSYLADAILVYCIRTKMYRTNEEILSLCFTKTRYWEMSVLDTLIKYEPSVVAAYFDSIINTTLEMWYTLIHSTFWMFCRYYSHLEFPEKIIAICSKIIENPEESDSKKKNSITALSFVMKSRDFLTFISPYYPSNLIMETSSPETATYKLQQAITSSVKNVVPPSLGLDSIIKFSKGDYLKFIQRSLYSVSHSAAEEKLVDFFAALTDRPVSVRKHVIYLTFKVLDRQVIYTMLKHFMETDKHSSIRKFLFKGAFRYFIKNPDDYLWEIVRQTVKGIEMKDKEAFDTLMDVGKIPPGYLAMYVMFTWEILESNPYQDQTFDEGKCRLLKSISPKVVPTIHKNFALELLEKHLFRSDTLTDLQRNIFEFACKLMIFSNGDEYLITVFGKLRDYCTNTWGKHETKTKGRKLVSSFVQQFCSFFLTPTKPPKDILLKFLNLWNDFLQPYQALEEYMYLKLSLIYVEFVSENVALEKISLELIKLQESLLEKYGKTISFIFNESLKNFVGNFLGADEHSQEENRLILIRCIVNENPSINGLVMGITLFTDELPTCPKNKLLHNQIIDKLEELPDPDIKLFLSCHFSGIGKTLDKPTCEDLDKYQSRRDKNRSLGTYIREFESGYKK